jgi:site-specific DNA recombinase
LFLSWKCKLSSQLFICTFQKARAAGLVFRKSGGCIPKSTVYAILRNRIYTGRFDWDGKTYQGRYEAIVPAELWDRVQDVMDGRNARRGKKGRRDFAFSASSPATPAAAQWWARSRRNATSIITAPVMPISARATPPSADANGFARKGWKRSSRNCSGGCTSTTKCWNGCATHSHASHADERREHKEAIKRHQAEYQRLNDRIHAMYVDKLDGLVDTAFFEKMSNRWREEQNCCQREIDRHQNADKFYLDEGIALLDLARNAQRLFAQQEPREKRRLLNFLLSNCTWKDGEGGRHIPPTF